MRVRDVYELGGFERCASGGPSERAIASACETMISLSTEADNS